MNYWLRILFPGSETASKLEENPPRQDLTVARALVLFGAFVLVMLLVPSLVYASLSPNADGTYSTVQIAFAALVGIVAAFALVFRMAHRVIGANLRLCQDTEAAWVSGDSGPLLIGAAVGIAVGLLAVAWQVIVPPPPDAEGLVMIAKLTTTPGLTAILRWPVLICIGPIAEELVYRGLLLGAFTKHFGRAPATAIVTLLFAASHYVVLMSYPAAVLPFLLVGVIAAVLRFWANAVGPAVAFHASYNALLGAAAVITTLLM